MHRLLPVLACVFALSACHDEIWTKDRQRTLRYPENEGETPEEVYQAFARAPISVVFVSQTRGALVLSEPNGDRIERPFRVLQNINGQMTVEFEGKHNTVIMRENVDDSVSVRQAGGIWVSYVKEHGP